MLKGPSWKRGKRVDSWVKRGIRREKRPTVGREQQIRAKKFKKLTQKGEKSEKAFPRTGGVRSGKNWLPPNESKGLLG